MAQAATSASSVPHQLGQPRLRAQAASGRTAMVRTSPSMTGATISAAARIPAPATTAAAAASRRATARPITGCPPPAGASSARVTREVAIARR